MNSKMVAETPLRKTSDYFLYRLFRIDPDFSANDLLARASCADAKGTAVGLVSMACVHKSLALAPRSLMRNHLQTAFASIHAAEAAGGEPALVDANVRCGSKCCLFLRDGSKD